MNADGIMGMLDMLRREVGPVPPGPERNRRVREVVKAHLDSAQSEQEQLFWGMFLKNLAEEAPPPPPEERGPILLGPIPEKP
jgi:hypothetical protein